ncbi:MAG: hypothetical protein K0R46_134 [Herbinix sp.]|nr:hypothetical protein [Herbinix sp.]
MKDVEEFWKRFLEEKHLDENTKYLEVFHFEVTEQGANQLLALVLSGRKRATASSLKAWEIEGKRPKVGDYSIVTDWEGKPNCVIRTTGITELPFKDMTYDICKREGEDECLETWQSNHRTFFAADAKELGYEFSEDMMVLFEDFEVIYRE